MYNDENNLYHYTYRKDGSETDDGRTACTQPSVDEQLHGYQAAQSGTAPQQPTQTMRPAKKNRMGLKITALALSCALVGGAAGAGIAWGISGGNSGKETVHVSSRPATEVSVKSVDGKNEMSDAENYASNVNSAVSINCSATTNYFGQTVQNA